MEPISVSVQGLQVSMKYHPASAKVGPAPLLVALHGGTYTSAYFGVAGGPFGSYLDLASRNGFSMLTIDRPGYGASTLLPEATNTFRRQAEILDAAIGQALSTYGNPNVVLVGHSIGGMIALEVAARKPKWSLKGAAVSGMCSRIPPGGPAEQLAGAPLPPVVDLPIPDRDRIMFGPAGSFTAAALEAAHATYAPTPFIELKLAPFWARERLKAVAAEIKVPVHDTIAELDALWDSSAAARTEFETIFGGRATSRLAPGVGHSIDHHILGARTQLEQLAFAYACVS